MKHILHTLEQFRPETLTYESLGKLVKSIDPAQVAYRELLPAFDESGNYTRNILMLDPLECVLLHWPPGVESAIHFHEGFWGYVLVLEGTCDNVEYQHTGDQLLERRLIRARRGGVLDEPDGTIHKIVNPSKTDTLVTAHFYYPALDTLDGLKLYDSDTGTIAVLNEKAPSASLNLSEDCFHSFETNAFTYVPLEKSGKARSHRTVPLLPKPEPDEIRSMIMDYYREQAKVYDDFDRLHPSRRKYTRKVNELLAEDLERIPEVDHLLAIACGTGRRALYIREKSGHDYHITCVDLSEEMCCQAHERGLETRIGPWLEVEVPDAAYDAVTFLYAFGHLPSGEERKKALQKIARKLKPGGALYLDLFNAEDENEWGPAAVRTFEDLQLEKVGYDRGDVFYQKVGGETIAFLHYFTEEGIRELLEETGFRVEWIRHIGYVYRSGEELTGEHEGALLVKAVAKM